MSSTVTPVELEGRRPCCARFRPRGAPRPHLFVRRVHKLPRLFNLPLERRDRSLVLVGQLERRRDLCRVGDDLSVELAALADEAPLVV